MLISGIPVFTNSPKKGNCVVCGKRMNGGTGFFHVYKKRLHRPAMASFHNPSLPDHQTTHMLFCSTDCVTLHSLRKEVI